MVLYTTILHMHGELLQELGLSLNEAKIYETLLSLGESGVGEIAVRGDIHRRNVYDALQRLITKGLVFPIFQKGENRYAAVRPEKLVELLREKELRLSEALPSLTALYETDPPH